MPDDSGMVDIFVIRIGEAEADNRAIESVLLSNEPVGMGMPVQITAVTRHPSRVTGSAEAMVELFVDGEKKAGSLINQATTVDTRYQHPVSFTHIFEHPGTHIGEVRLTSDRLPLDDVRYFAVDVLGQIKVLCVGESLFWVKSRSCALASHTSRLQTCPYTMLSWR
jgi:hypothetical protein